MQCKWAATFKSPFNGFQSKALLEATSLPRQHSSVERGRKVMLSTCRPSYVDAIRAFK